MSKEVRAGRPAGALQAGGLLALVRANGRGIALELFVNLALPFAIFTFAQPRLGDAHALMVSAAPPIAWSIVEFVRRRRIDALSLLVIASTALGVIGYLLGGGVHVLQLRHRLVTGVIAAARASGEALMAETVHAEPAQPVA